MAGVEPNSGENALIPVFPGGEEKKLVWPGST